jgi:uncharacterized protein YjiS (DUF1127 family)
MVACFLQGLSTMKHASLLTVNIPTSATAQVRILERIFRARLFRSLRQVPVSLISTWHQRTSLRAELIADLRDRPEYLRDIGVCEHAARFEATRFFWEPVLLKRNKSGLIEDVTAGLESRKDRDDDTATNKSEKYPCAEHPR